MACGVYQSPRPKASDKAVDPGRQPGEHARPMLRFVLSFLCVGCASTAAARPPVGLHDLLDTRLIGAESLLSRHREWDGRGVVIAVLDTGVDPSAVGLKTTSAGKVKVLAVRDFSGQGQLSLEQAERVEEGGERLHRTGEITVRGLDSLPAPADGWRVAVLRETAFRQSSVTDLNANGVDTDVFAIAVGDFNGRAAAFVDTDGNLDLRDALRVEDYGVAQQTFTLRPPDPRDAAPLNLALHLEDGELVVHFDDGGHGTHVAGIAAGYRLFGRSDLHGVAPGAQVLSLKIGDNTLAGGATTSDSMRRALDFAGKWSRDHGVPVIANISYGIGSEDEGRSEMDGAVDELMARYPLLVVSISAGNEGPGLSTVGIPASSTLGTAVAAMLPKAAAETLFGSKVADDVLFSFSSRGGEVAKPDLAAPGIASAATAPWDDTDVKAGTSMAAPMVSGAYALVASALVAQNIRLSNATLKRALLGSARPLEGYALTDQGAGVPDVGRAVALARGLAEADEPFLVAGYRVTTAVPTSPSGEGAAAYFRAGTWLPDAEDGQTFTIEPIFYEGQASAAAAHFGLVALSAEAGWLDPSQGRLRFKGAAPQSVVLRHDLSELSPGVTTGRVLGVPEGGDGAPAFSLWTTIVTPHRFTADNDYTLASRGTLAPAALRRYPIQVPPGATSLALDVQAGDFANAQLAVFDPAGRPVTPDEPSVSSRLNTSARLQLTGDRLKPGVWEVVVVASPSGPKTSEYTLSAVFRGLEFAPIRRLTQAVGAPPSGVVTVTNRYDTRFSGTVQGALRGFRRERQVSVEGDAWTYAFEVDGETKEVDFLLRLEPKVYNLFTDVALTVYGGGGEALAKDGFVNGRARLSVPVDGAGHLRLELRGAFANSEKVTGSWTLEVQEDHLRRNPIPISGPPVTLYPSVPVEVEFDLGRVPPRVPDGFNTLGEVVLTDDASGDVWAAIPVITR